jgi:class 3 adenylate cyclase/ABC-type branched-subunit amino acid transport system substrate-binding protein
MTVDQPGSVTRGFLFADLRGYTDFVEQRGAAAAADLLTRYRELARDAIGRFGGAEIKTEGDSFYVVFDSVSSAVRCGLAIAADAKVADEAIRVGIGVHAGETVEADGGYVGSAVNIAARICAQAGPGEVLVSETVRALTSSLLPASFKSRGRRQLKGIAEPIELFTVEERPEGATAWPSTRRPRLTRRTRAALVGGAVLVLAAAVGIGWLATRPSTGLPEGAWTIGVHVPLSGTVFGSEGIAVRNAVQLAIDEANESGAAGAELALKAYDTGSEEDGENPARAAAAVRKMAKDPRTIAAVGPFSSPSAGETIPITNRAGLLECSPANSHPSLTKPEFGALEFRATHPNRINYVRISPSADVLSPALAAFATHDLDAESALLVWSPRWPELRDGFVEEFSALGGQVVQSRFAPGADANAVLEPLRRAEGAPDVVVFAGATDDGAARVRRAMHAAGLGEIPFLSWDTIQDGSGASEGSFLQRAGEGADGSYFGHTAIPPPRADFVGAYRAAFREEPTEYAAAAYACMQVILASLDGVAEDGPSGDELREALRARAVDPDRRYETVLGTFGFDANGDSTQQMVSFYRVDPRAADGAGDWALIKQQDFGPP